MPKEWVLNSANMRWGLNKKTQVGAVSEEIRKCSPREIRDWEEYYYKKVYPKSHLIELGKKLYTKVSEVIRAEIDEITEEEYKEQEKELLQWLDAVIKSKEDD